MIRALQRSIGALVAVACAVHVAITILYLAPPNLVEAPVHAFVTSYMTPLFVQNWHLFSPNPGFASSQLWVRCSSIGGEPGAQGDQAHPGDWVDPFQAIREKHYANRVSGRGKLLYVYNGIATKLIDAYNLELAACAREAGDHAVSTCEKDTIARRAANSGAFEVAKRFASQFCAAQNPLANQAQFKVMTFYPKKFSERDAETRWGRVDEKVFPAVVSSPDQVATSR